MTAQRFYSSTATATALTSGVNGSVTTIFVASVTGFPVSFPYTLILDEGETSEEVVQVNSASGLSLAVTRGVDNTTGVPHPSGARVIHGVSARDYREPQEHIGATSNVHGVTGTLVGLNGSGDLSLPNNLLVGATIAGSDVSATGNISAGGNLFATGGVNAAAGIITGNVSAGGSVTAGGNVSGNTFRFGVTGDEVRIAPVGNSTVEFINPGASLWATLKAAAFSVQSTRDSKEDIRGSGYGLDAVQSLEPVQFRYKDDPTPRVGFIAEDIAAVVPEAVTFSEGKPTGVDLGALVPVLVAAIQELAERLDRLEA